MTIIAVNKVVSIHYTLTSGDGEELDSSAGGEPLAYLHGFENIVPGLERRLEGKGVGDKLTAVVPPAEAYGELSGMQPQPVPRSAFEGAEPQEGMPLLIEDDDGNEAQFWISEVHEEVVFLSPDHPLAGITLCFDVEVVEVRDATEEELAHGHVHMPGHHHH
ncbi:FKBP-type peptidyl-prolyl cis-trans isomerase [Paraliomyxa miuraensis]|uniref:FKBP-type peptidyl-prolyl cis-trans isomerase n=1 Tax=Paraliomyxa miuraensis TaxID=376150 RepID=UPI002252B57F|nr:peptidylprolyl isomerase [Paraliomyxa miuraensis]MCX4244076.1 peptidylprolyl isomerase [Paraliomyxa miuraensis]